MIACKIVTLSIVPKYYIDIMIDTQSTYVYS